ncbi:MAG: HVO_A0114 family putative DNA-binding protein [Paludibacter sp.]
MKIKKVIIEIKPLKDTLKGFAEAFGKVKNGEKITPTTGISFSDVDAFRKFFSKKRMELLSAIKHKQPKSIYQLAIFLNRGYKNVYNDVILLEELGLISRENNSVDVDFNKLCVEVAV